jgi:hypothetical protein
VCPSSLDHEEHLPLPLWSFQGAKGIAPQKKARPEDGLSKLNSVDVEVDVIPGEPAGLDGLA